ncbi:MAG: glutamate-5-semialdehyde dehydrogenase [Duncaniella sp.]|nr:glutamate-5-semialdehyde dehydrogenase [Duncaniella sp.]
MTDYNEIFDRVKAASRIIAPLSDSDRSRVLDILARLVEENIPMLLEANARDLARMNKDNPLYDRLQLTEARLKAISDDLRHVARLDCPAGEEIERRTLPNGILLRKIRVPFGVVGVVYEARPNVTFDVAALCLKSGNACILKGGHDAEQSNLAALDLIHHALNEAGLPHDSVALLPSTHEATEALLSAVGKVDVCIPRGGRKLIDFVRDTARVPVIETGAGVVNMYFDASAREEIARAVVDNAKTRRVSVCNALDSLLVNATLLPVIASWLRTLAEKRVELHADRRAMAALLSGGYPGELLVEAIDADKDREWMDMKMGVYTVDDVAGAIAHIAAHGSGHSESIVAEDKAAIEEFTSQVDAACVYVNLPTSFTDGGQFGLGAEIGISTQKLGPRGPMGLREITTYRYLLEGNGQTRS